MSKKKLLIFSIFLITLTSWSQEKIKGNKNVTIIETKINDFHTIELGEKFVIELIQNTTPSVEIETDENLHKIIQFSVKDSVLSFKTSAKIQSSKRLNIKVNTTQKLQNIILYNDAEIVSVNTLNSKQLNLKINDYAKAFLTTKNKQFTLINNNKSTFGINSKSKLNIESDKIKLELNENSKTEALIKTDSLHVELYQSAVADLEGDVNYLELNAINSSDFNAKQLTTNTSNVITEDSCDVIIQTLNNLNLEMSGTSEIYIYGEPQINLKSLKNKASIYKKEL